MVELASKRFVCIVDESKLVQGLGGSKGDSIMPSLLDPTLPCFACICWSLCCTHVHNG